MSTRRPLRVTTRVACLVATLSALSAASALAQGRWTYSLYGGSADRFIYQVSEHEFGDHADSFASGVQGGLGATRTLTRHVSLRLEAGYRGYSTWLGLAQIPEAPPTSAVRIGSGMPRSI